MKFLVAGASGFIGKAIVKAVKDNDPDSHITGLSRNPPSSLDYIDEYVACDLSAKLNLEQKRRRRNQCLW
ncbi:MAG: NAD-dependent epimerase/dehydratase family protein [Granulosicoccus sp.]